MANYKKQKSSTQATWWKLDKFTMVHILFATLLWMSWANNSTAQEVVELKQRYPGSAKVKTKSDFEYRIKNTKNGINIVSEEIEEYIIIDEKGIMDNKLSAYHSDLVPIIEQEAYTILPNKKKIPIKNIMEKDYESGSIFHNGVKEKMVQYSHLELGSRKYLMVQKEYKDPFLLHKHIFAEGVPQLNNTFRIVADRDIKIGYRVFNEDQHKIIFSKKENRNSIEYEWKLEESKPFRVESNSLGILYNAPHIVFFIEEYTNQQKDKVKMLGSIDLLSNYYNGFVKDLNQIEYPALKQIAIDITKDVKGDEEKLKTIYYWVKDNIRYVAFESGYEGFIPREAGVIFDRKFGDCKDMASIITAMAAYAQVPNVFLTWIGTNELPYTYEQVPTPAVDNHMIAAYRRGNEYIYLDATNKETPYGLPSSFIQGKEALIKTDKGFVVEKVNPVPAAHNVYKLITELAITPDKTVTGTASVSMSGLFRDHIINSSSGLKGDRKSEFYKSLLKLGNNKFTLKEYQEYNLKNRDTTYDLNYQYQIQDYLVSHNNESYISLFVDQPWSSLIIEDNRKSPYDLRFLHRYDYTIILKKPQGSTATYIPKNVSEDNSVMKYKVNYQEESDQIVLHFSIENKKLALFTTEEFQTWNNSIKSLNKLYKETIILLDNTKK